MFPLFVLSQYKKIKQFTITNEPNYHEFHLTILFNCWVFFHINMGCLAFSLLKVYSNLLEKIRDVRADFIKTRYDTNELEI